MHGEDQIHHVVNEEHYPGHSNDRLHGDRSRALQVGNDLPGVCDQENHGRDGEGDIHDLLPALLRHGGKPSEHALGDSTSATWVGQCCWGVTPSSAILARYTLCARRASP